MEDPGSPGEACKEGTKAALGVEIKGCLGDVALEHFGEPHWEFWSFELVSCMLQDGLSQRSAQAGLSLDITGKIEPQGRGSSGLMAFRVLKGSTLPQSLSGGFAKPRNSLFSSFYQACAILESTVSELDRGLLF